MMMEPKFFDANIARRRVGDREKLTRSKHDKPGNMFFFDIIDSIGDSHDLES